MLQVFSFESKEVRFVGTAENPAWIGKDACIALNISKYRDALADLNEDERMSVVVDTPGGKQKMTAVNEAGLYQLVLKAPPHVAQPFTRWLTHDVIPSIRKTGSYSVNEPSTPGSTVKDELDIINFCLSVAGLDPKLTAGVMLNHAGGRVPQLKDAVKEGHNLLAASFESDLLLTPTKIGKELGVSARRINQILLDLGYQAKNLTKTSKTEPDYLVTDIGKPYANNTLATGQLQNGKADNSTYQHLKWKPEVAEIVREYLTEG